MARTVIGFLGVFTMLYPGRIIGIFEDVAIENSNECTIKPWIRSGIRAEGVVVTVASLIGGRTYARMMNLTRIFGAVVLLFPQLYRKFATTLLYEKPDEVKWNDQFTKEVRIIGAVYVFLAARAFKNRRGVD